MAENTEGTAVGERAGDESHGVHSWGTGAIKPFLKWPGGKRDMLKHIAPLLPKTFRNYFEPFMGGGAVFFSLCPARATLADRNERLIRCYVQVRDHPEDVIRHLRRMPNTKDDYYRIRGLSPTCEAEGAARLIYLVTLSFNGIYRVNQQGAFNVPYGYKSHLDPCAVLAIRAASQALSGTDLLAADFEQSLKQAREGDLVYLDPPYTVVHSQNGFLKYNDRIFSWDDQKRLAQMAARLARRGCHVIVSNADHSEIRRLYKEFDLQTVDRPSVIAASRIHRRRVTECLFYKEGKQ